MRFYPVRKLGFGTCVEFDTTVEYQIKTQMFDKASGTRERFILDENSK